jgi:ketosteroid isomerase-like protein
VNPDRAARITKLFTAFNERDAQGWLSNVTDDFEMQSRFSSVSESVFHGREGFDAWWRDLEEAWDPMSIHLEAAADIGPEHTVLLVRLHGRGRGSGVAVDEELALSWHWRGPKVAKIEYIDRTYAEKLMRG